jgi:hypothetical protein
VAVLLVGTTDAPTKDHCCSMTMSRNVYLVNLMVCI